MSVDIHAVYPHGAVAEYTLKFYEYTLARKLGICNEALSVPSDIFYLFKIGVFLCKKSCKVRYRSSACHSICERVPRQTYCIVVGQIDFVPIGVLVVLCRRTGSLGIFSKSVVYERIELRTVLEIPILIKIDFFHNNVFLFG